MMTQTTPKTHRAAPDGLSHANTTPTVSDRSQAIAEALDAYLSKQGLPRSHKLSPTQLQAVAYHAGLAIDDWQVVQAECKKRGSRQHGS